MDIVEEIPQAISERGVHTNPLATPMSRFSNTVLSLILVPHRCGIAHKLMATSAKLSTPLISFNTVQCVVLMLFTWL